MVLLELGLNTSLTPVAKQYPKLMCQDMWPLSMHQLGVWGDRLVLRPNSSFPTDFWGLFCHTSYLWNALLLLFLPYVSFASLEIIGSNTSTVIPCEVSIFRKGCDFSYVKLDIGNNDSERTQDRETQSFRPILSSCASLCGHHWKRALSDKYTFTDSLITSTFLPMMTGISLWIPDLNILLRCFTISIGKEWGSFH